MKTHKDEAVRKALDLAFSHFPDRHDRAVGLVRAQCEALGIELQEGFGEIRYVDLDGNEVEPEPTSVTWYTCGTDCEGAPTVTYIKAR